MCSLHLIAAAKRDLGFLERADRLRKALLILRDGQPAHTRDHSSVLEGGAHGGRFDQAQLAAQAGVMDGCQWCR